MSSTVVRRNFMSCSDLQETTATLKLKVLDTSPAEADRRESRDLGSWAFLRRQYPPKYCSKDQEQEDGDACRYSCNEKMTAATSYAAKPYNNCFPRLSQESLELCTENLGSESGSDVLQEPSSQLGPQDSTAQREGIRSAAKLRMSPSVSRRNKGSNFPPPLTTMSGASPLQVTRHVSNGRLIIEAVERPLRNGVLQAERSGGRLRLSFFKPAEDGGDEPAEEEEGNTEERREVEEDVHGRENNYRWMSRCKGGHGGGNIHTTDNGGNWHKPALWVVTS